MFCPVLVENIRTQQECSIIGLLRGVMSLPLSLHNTGDWGDMRAAFDGALDRFFDEFGKEGLAGLVGV